MALLAIGTERMELILNIEGKLDLIAIYAAVVATAILIWDVAKWLRTGPRIKLRASANMEMLNDPDPRRVGKTYILVVVTNVGSSPTTVTHLAVAFYKNQWDRVRRRPKEQGVIMIAQATPHLPLPHVLRVGEEWSGMIEQDLKIVQWTKNGVLYAEVYDSVHKRPARVRIIIPDS